MTLTAAEADKVAEIERLREEVAHLPRNMLVDQYVKLLRAKFAAEGRSALSNIVEWRKRFPIGSEWLTPDGRIAKVTGHIEDGRKRPLMVIFPPATNCELYTERGWFYPNFQSNHDLAIPWSERPLPPAPNAEAAPYHTDLMVAPESIDAWMEKNPLPEEPSAEGGI